MVPEDCGPWWQSMGIMIGAHISYKQGEGKGTAEGIVWHIDHLKS